MTLFVRLLDEKRIDYPGLNLRMAKALRKAGYKGKLIHYICPSVRFWQLNSWDKMIFPKPFAKIHAQIGEPIQVLKEKSTDEQISFFENALLNVDKQSSEPFLLKPQ